MFSVCRYGTHLNFKFKLKFPNSHRQNTASNHIKSLRGFGFKGKSLFLNNDNREIIFIYPIPYEN